MSLLEQSDAEKSSAVKLFICDVRRLQQSDGSMGDATTTQSPSFWRLGTYDIEYVWLQGHVIHMNSAGTRFVLDDGTGTIYLICDQLFQGENSNITKGSYVMVIGKATRQSTSWFIVVEKIVDYSQDPNRDAVWMLEVIESACERHVSC